MKGRIELQHLKADATGGMLAAIIGLPMGLAFGVQSGLGAQAGLFTAIALAIIAALFGGTRTLISDPTGPMTVVAATVVSMGLTQAGSMSEAWPLIVGTFLLAGLFELIFGLLDFGKYVKFLPYPVLSGFMAGIGVIIISMQLFPILGYSSPRGFMNIITQLPQPIAKLNGQALFLGVLTMVIIYGLPFLTRKVPPILVALIAGTLISVWADMEVPVIGEIPRQLPPFRLGEVFQLHWQDLQHMITPAFMLGGLGVIDTLLTSVVADSITRSRHDSKRTIIGQGVGNMLTALFGGLPGAGATMGTVTNIRAGAQTPLSGLLKGLFLLLIILGVADLVQYIPMSVLAGILITVGVGIIDYKGIQLLRKVPRSDVAVWVIVLLVTLFDNLLDAVGIGFVLSAVLFIGKMSKNFDASLKSQLIRHTPFDDQMPEELRDQVHIKQLEGPLFFGFAHAFRAEARRIRDVKAVVLHMKYMPFIDQSGIVTLESVIQDWEANDIKVFMAGANPVVAESLRKVGIVPRLIPEAHCFGSFEACVEQLSLLLEDCGISE